MVPPVIGPCCGTTEIEALASWNSNAYVPTSDVEALTRLITTDEGGWAGEMHVTRPVLSICAGTTYLSPKLQCKSSSPLLCKRVIRVCPCTGPCDGVR
eukprot:2575333-Prymnesium_polylepis.1